MVKVKNKKRNLSENVNKKKEVTTKKVLNPFEVHINNEKLKVLGRKLKNDRGLPGVSRAKALQKRKHTLLPEYQLQNKSNKFIDKRIGERSKDLNDDEKTMARYAAVRMKQHNRKSIFNLADDEVLTHKGQTLSEIEKFEDPRSDDDEDEDEEGRQKKSGALESRFVKDAHFGGGMLKKSDGIKSHKDLIDQLIAESKKRKVEKQKQKEATLELTEKLDTEWKDLLPLVSKNTKQKGDDDGQNIDDFDKVMRELKFEARGTPSDKLKTEDEIAKEEKEKLERLERERLERMQGIVGTTNKTPKHRSADDLDDNFAYDSDTPDVTLSYNEEGKSNIQMELPPAENGEEANNSDEEEDIHDEDDEEVETDSEDNLSDLKDSDNSGSEDEVEPEIEEVEAESEKLEAEIKEIEELEAETEEVEESQSKTPNGNKENNIDNKIKSKKRKQNDESTMHKKLKLNDEEVKNNDKLKEDLLRIKSEMEAARRELPYTYSLPENYETLNALLVNQPPINQGVIIERIIKCNHPSLKEGNKEALGLIFVYLLQHITDIADEATPFKTFMCLVPQLFDLAQLNPENAHTSMLEVIKEKQAEFKKHGSKYPGVEVLLYLKLVSCLFSTSDFRHKVVIPSLVFIEQMLTRCKVRTKFDVAFGLFLVSLVVEYTALSKRYVPGAVKYLAGVLHMAVPKNSVQLLKILPPFKSTSTSLVITSKIPDATDLKLDVEYLTNTSDFDDTFRIKALNVTIGLLKAMYAKFHLLPSCLEIFESTIPFLNRLPANNYPEKLTKQIQSLTNTIEEYKNNRKLEFIVMEKKKPKALRLYEPNIEKVYDGKKHKVQSKEKAERDKLLHKLKREKKGALREIRRDKAFLGRVKIGQRIQSDVERHAKVKRIYSEAAMQQSELNSMDRKNSRKKK